MSIISKRLKGLRTASKLSQVKLATLAETQQTTIQRYETGNSAPSAKLLLWYADYFDVSLDYIFGRTENPQGCLYKYHPKSLEVKPENRLEIEQFIEMCFDPNSPMSVRLKETMINMLEETNADKR